MDRAVRRLERLHITTRYLQLWLPFMDEAEKQLHLSRIIADLNDASQAANYWRDFARENGIELPDEGATDG